MTEASLSVQALAMTTGADLSIKHLALREKACGLVLYLHGGRRALESLELIGHPERDA